MLSSLRASKLWPWLRDLGLVALIVLGVRAYQQRNLPAGAAPALEGVDIIGAPASLAALRGKPMVLHFWATWCGVCAAEQSNIDSLARDVPVLTVASRSGDAAHVASYVREHAVEPRVVLDESGALAKRFGVTAYPTPFIIDAAGEIRSAEVGYTTELGLRARLWLAGAR